MNITINGLQLGAGTPFQIEAPVEGLETPPIRTSQQNYSGRDGGIVNGQYYSPRLITISGFIIGGTCESHESARRDLQDALPIREDLDVTISTFSGIEYVTTVRVMDIKMPIIDPKGSKFKIDIFASDPNLYLSALNTVQIPIESGGGFILPVVFPIVFASGSNPTIVNNTGSVVVYPIFTITGEALNPVITNVDTGEKIDMNLTMTGTDELIIDMLNRTITLNGSSVISYRTTDSDWFGLEVGNNRFSYSTDDLTDTGIAEISWRTAVTSI